MTGMVKAVLFDMDGILYDSEYYYMNGTIDQMHRWGYTGDDRKIYAILGTTMEDTYQIMYDLLGGKVPIEKLAEGNERYFLIEHPLDYKKIMFPGIPEALRELKEMGLKTAVCSSSPYQTITDSLDAMGIRELFDFIESGERVPHAKPAGDIYLMAAEALNTKTEDCLVYEDSCLGIQAGKNAGIFTAARKDDRFFQDQSAADLMVSDIQELVSWIRKENNYGRSNEN